MLYNFCGSEWKLCSLVLYDYFHLFHWGKLHCNKTYFSTNNSFSTISKHFSKGSIKSFWEFQLHKLLVCFLLWNFFSRIFTLYWKKSKHLYFLFLFFSYNIILQNTQIWKQVICHVFLIIKNKFPTFLWIRIFFKVCPTFFPWIYYEGSENLW